MNNKIRFIGFNMQQIGDIFMNTVAARSLKETYPNSHLTLGVANKYKDLEPLFKNHPYIEDFHVYEGYDGLTENDYRWLNNNDFYGIFNPMPQHKNQLWYNDPDIKCQTAEVCRMHDLPIPNDLSVVLNKWFDKIDKFRDYICIAPFTLWKRKNLSNQKWQKIIDYIVEQRGFQVLQLGGQNEFPFKRTFYPNLSIYSWPPWDYFQSVKAMLSCVFTMGLDGGLAWCSSGYKHPFLGLYGHSYDNLISPKVYEPINENAIYLESQNAEDIPNELIFQKIDEMIDKYY